MTPGTWVLVAVAGAAGAVARHEVTSRAADDLRALHVCNVLGAAALGVLLGARVDGTVAIAVGAGGLGAFTSFSTWVVGARARARDDRQGGRVVLLHLGLPLALAVAAAVLGLLVGEALGGRP